MKQLIADIFAKIQGLDDKITLQKFPYPYKAALAISNDCEFMSWEAKLELYRFLGSDKGLGLEISNSLFFFVTNSVCHSSFSYFKGTSDIPCEYTPTLHEMIQVGYIDTIHAYGDFDKGGFQRSFAERVLAECERYGLTFKVWSNHGSDKNFQNMGHQKLTNYQHGDEPDHPCYHLDLLRGCGVRYFWVDDGFIVKPGVDTPILYQEQARDGSSLTLFRRYRGLIGKPAPNAGSLPEQILIDDINTLIAHEQACIYYQHLGVWRKTPEGYFEANVPPFFSQAGLQVLEYLAQVYHEGTCLVATVSRLLRYLEVRDSLSFSASKRKIVLTSTLEDISAKDFEGITFCLARPTEAQLVWRQKNGTEVVLPSQVFIEKQTKEALIGIPWKRLGGFLW